MSTPLGRYRVMSLVTGVVLALLVLVATPLKIVTDSLFADDLVGLGWTAHGWLYMLYVVTVINLAFVSRWGLLKTIGVMVAGTVPLAVFFVEPRVAATERRAGAASG